MKKLNIGIFLSLLLMVGLCSFMFLWRTEIEHQAGTE